MAEQAINTIYTLAERPDIVCDSLIKDLCRRAFGSKSRAKTPQPKEPEAMDEDDAEEKSDHTTTQAQIEDEKDTGDAFPLSQLLFVVGHVAIKHIVYLELVEREWKRQKHEKETGERWCF